MNIQKAVKKIVGENNKKKILLLYKIYRSDDHHKFIKYGEIVHKSKVYKLNNNMGLQYKKIFSKCRIEIDDNIFFYSVDFCSILETTDNATFGNLTIDYSKIMNKSIEELIKEYSKSKSQYSKNIAEMLNGISILCDRIIDIVGASDNKNKENIINAFNKIKSDKPNSLFEAMQKILFYNQLQWQVGINLVGLGRLDKILDPYYKKENTSKENVDTFIRYFYLALHKDYCLKSNGLVGDTGQIIILGGEDKKHNYFSNYLTYSFINILKIMKIPDPKILLRVSSKMPEAVLDTALNCICTGIGSPLFANDDVIINKLKEYGMEEDSYDYVTSACWEPLIAGKSIDSNNIATLNFLNPFNELLNSNLISDIKSKDDLINSYLVFLEKYINDLKEKINEIKYNNNLLLSMLIDDCKKKEKDVGEGGANYNNYGVTSVGMSGVVNSILNIDYYVFKEKKFTLEEINDARKNNYVNGNIEMLLKNSPIVKYGCDDSDVIKLVNTIIAYTNKYVEGFKNYMGGSLKFGLSSPAYITDSKNFPASLDGRKNKEPFSVHISSSSVGYTELFNFASKLDYGKYGFNGNVIDFIVSPSFIKNNYDKFKEFIMKSIKNGFYEMQMNVVDSKTLIAAKNNPKEFPNLIVRVWGFSTYFNELPEEYKNLLIERAIANENNSN